MFILLAESTTVALWGVFVAVIGHLIALGALILQISKANAQQKKEYDWRKAEQTSQMMSQWSERVANYRKTLERRIGDLSSRQTEFVQLSELDQKRFLFAGKRRLTPGGAPDPIAQLQFADPTEQEWLELREAVIGLLNWFEDLAQMYRRRMLDDAIVESTFENAIINYYDKIQPLAELIDIYDFGKGDGGPKESNWQPVKDLVNAWKQKRRPPDVEPMF